MPKTIDFAVEKAIRDKKIDLVEFTKAHPSQIYYEDYKTFAEKYPDRLIVLDLSHVMDQTLLRRIVGFLWYEMNPERRTPFLFRENKVRSIWKMLSFVSSDALSDYMTFRQEIFNVPEDVKAAKEVTKCARQFIRYCDEADCEDDPYSADVWHLYHMNIDESRLNYAKMHKRLYFTKIDNLDNRELVKQHAKYILVNTDLTVNTLVSRVSHLSSMLNCIEKAYTSWSKNDAETMVSLLRDKGFKDRTIGNYLITLEVFTEYLLLNDIIEDSPIKHLHDLTHTEYEYKATANDKYVLMQIFNAMGSFHDSSLVVCFLIIYCTGMRVSEACTMKKECLEASGGNTFIRFYQPKMKKHVTNQIPKALYEMIEEQRFAVPKDTEWLFPGQRMKRPRGSSTFVSCFKKELQRFSIKNTDGTPYNFTPHSFRHLMAVRMRDKDIPFQYIQEQLQHESPEMTLAYTEFLDRQKIAKMKHFVNANGDETPIAASITAVDDEEYAEHLRKYINAQILPNGLCDRPVQLGKCKHNNACLRCKDFRTSEDFLDVHEEQLKQTERYIAIADQNGWIVQADDARENCKILRNLIERLKHYAAVNE